MKRNRLSNGSDQLSDSLIYKGTNGDTVTGGEDLALFQMTGEGRLFATVDAELAKGDNFSIRIDVTGTTIDNMYAAIIGHLRRT